MDYDDAYANAAYIPNADQYIERWTAEAEAFRKDLIKQDRCTLAVPYGPSARQVYDEFRPIGVAKGTFVFVHGGYWLRFDRSYWSHFAQGALDSGWRVIMPSYDLCPTVSIAQITQQITAAVEQIAQRYNGDIVLSGHSAGGHLVARLSCEGVLTTKIFARIRHVCPISPVSDLRPLRHTAMNEMFKLTEADVIAESPALIPYSGKKVTCFVGADERPAFLDQARWLSEAWGCQLSVLEGKHHFDVIDPLADPNSAMMQTMLGTAEKS